MKFAVIFDMDGVLIDSTKNIWEAFSILLKRHGIEYTKEEHKSVLGTSLRDKIEMWKKEYGIEVDHAKFSEEATKM